MTTRPLSSSLPLIVATPSSPILLLTWMVPALPSLSPLSTLLHPHLLHPPFSCSPPHNSSWFFRPPGLLITNLSASIPSLSPLSGRSPLRALSGEGGASVQGGALHGVPLEVQERDQLLGRLEPLSGPPCRPGDGCQETRLLGGQRGDALRAGSPRSGRGHRRLPAGRRGGGTTHR